jgi:N-methylhydantoinase A/oxoprolinase/acetone carboxylase beta subunit
VLSALGLAVADRRRDFARSVMLSGADLTAANLDSVVDQLSGLAKQELSDADLNISYDIRYTGQAFELAVETASTDPNELRSQFDELHSERYGYADEDASLEVVNVRVAAVATRAAPELTSPGDQRQSVATRQVMFDGRWVETELHHGQPPAGADIRGPALILLDDATIVVPPGWRARADQRGTVTLEKSP